MTWRGPGNRGASRTPQASARRAAAGRCVLEDAYADYVLAGTDWLVPAPPELSAEAASMLPTVGAVALGALRAGRLATGETVLVTSGAGGIGHLAVQLARLLGAGTAAAGLGADVTVSHADPGWPEQVRAAVPGGVDVALDAVGGEALHASVGLLAPLGRVVVYGAASGELTSVPVRGVFGLKTLTGFSLLSWRAAAAAQARADIAELTGLLGSGELRVMTRTIPLSEAVQAHRLLESRAVAGRLILVP